MSLIFTIMVVLVGILVMAGASKLILELLIGILKLIAQLFKRAAILIALLFIGYALTHKEKVKTVGTALWERVTKSPREAENKNQFSNY